MKIQSPRYRKVIASILFVALINVGTINLTSVWAAGTSKPDNQAIGQLVVSGSVTVNDKKAINGTTIYNNSRLGVACVNGNRAVVNLGKLGRVEMAPGSQMVLKFADGVISGDLVMGKVVVSAPPGVKVAINTPEGVSAADGKDASVLAVATQRGVRCVPVVTSQSSSSLTLGSGALAAILLGATGAAIAGAVVSTQDQASGINP